MNTATATKADKATTTAYDRDALFESMCSAASAALKAGVRLNDAAARWATGEILAGETRESVGKRVAGDTTLSGVLKASTVASGWGSAIERTARAFNLLADRHPELAMVHVQLGVTGAPAYSWAGQFRGKPARGQHVAGDTFAPMTITAAMDHAVELGADRLAELVRRDAEFVGALNACGVPVLEFVQLWHKTGNVKGTDDTTTDVAANTDATDANTDANTDATDNADPWRYVALAVEALARVEAHASDLTPSQRATAWKSLGASMTAVRSAYVAANDAATAKA